MRADKCLAVFLTSILLLAGLPAAAHEFWMTSTPFAVPTGGTADVNLYVGQFFEGDSIPLSAQYVTDFHRYTVAGAEDLIRLVPRSSRGGVSVAFKTPGAHVLAIDTHPNLVTLSEDQFNYYLADEGLSSIKQLREERGGSPGAIEAAKSLGATKRNREQYRRHIKALVRVGGKSDETVFMHTGQRLEIVPLADPLFWQAGTPHKFRVLYEGKQLAGVLVKAWNKQNMQTLAIRAVANDEGLVSLNLPFRGMWMLSAVHMLPVTDDPALDWQSLWANLSFELD
ncbi:MAG: hypothetical protein JWR22_3025 [Herminiimonas sp.]|nr:hypothetical protein [Herminiimonas sp.]